MIPPDPTSSAPAPTPRSSPATNAAGGDTSALRTLVEEALSVAGDWFRPETINVGELTDAVVAAIVDETDALARAARAGALPGCDGSLACPAPAHEHGCHADTLGRCDEPSEHVAAAADSGDPVQALLADWDAEDGWRAVDVTGDRAAYDPWAKGEKTRWQWCTDRLRDALAARPAPTTDLEAAQARIRAAMERTEAQARAAGREYALLDDLVRDVLPAVTGLPGVDLADLGRVLTDALHYSADPDDGECLDDCSGCAADRLRATLGVLVASKDVPIYELSPGAFMTIDDTIPPAPERCTYPGTVVGEGNGQA